MIVYAKGTPHEFLPDEFGWMTQEPIAYEPTDPSETMSPTSRVRLGKSYGIECNVKVRDIGMVAREDRSKLLRYFREERDNGFEDEYDDDDTPQTRLTPSK
jgi:hypothetical protein